MTRLRRTGAARHDGRRSRHGVVGGFLPAALLLAVTACGSSGAADTASASAPITCAPGAISGSGSSAQEAAMEVWTSTYTAACASKITYRSVGSSAGLDDFGAGRTSFGGSDSPPRGAQKTAIDARCGGDALSLPMVVGPIAVVYTLPGVTDLQLSPATLARILSGAITRWDDPAIMADNAGATLPAMPIVTVHRADGSGTTDNITRFLAATAGSAWPYGSGLRWAAPGGLGVAGNEDVTATVRRTPGAIGYAELFYAENAGLLTARVRNAAGDYVGPSALAASVGLSSALTASPTAGTGAPEDLTLTFDYTTPIPGAYPIYLVSYEVVCRNRLPPEQAALVRSFLAYAASSSGQQQVSDIGYAPLPQSLAIRVRAAVGSLR